MLCCRPGSEELLVLVWEETTGEVLPRHGYMGRDGQESRCNCRLLGPELHGYGMLGESN